MQDILKKCNQWHILFHESTQQQNLRNLVFNEYSYKQNLLL